MSGLSPDARDLFRSARAEFEPDEENIEALRTAIAGSLGAGASLAGPAHGGGGATATGLAGGVGVKVIGTILLAAAIGGGAVWGARHVKSPAFAGASVAASPAPASLDNAARAPLRRDPSPTIGARPAPETAAGSSMPAIAPGAPPELPVESLPSSPAVPDGMPRRRAHRVSPGAGAPRISADGPRSDAAPSLATAATASDVEVAPTPAPTQTSLAQETRLLRDAQAALDRGDPQGALVRVHQHELLYPAGTLEEERLVLRVMALCALARPDEAREVARQIWRVAPNSPHLAGIRASCVGTRYNE
jgi:hypothetical protein